MCRKLRSLAILAALGVSCCPTDWLNECARQCAPNVSDILACPDGRAACYCAAMTEDGKVVWRYHGEITR